MPQYLKYVDESTQTLDFSRGYYVEPGTLDLAFEKIPVGVDFGSSHKDVVEFSAYDSTGENMLGWAVVAGAENYTTKQLRFTNYDGETTTASIRVLDSIYPSANGNIILSPVTELKEIGLASGIYRVGISF